MGTLLSGCAHDDLGFASGASSGWGSFSSLFTYPAGVRNVGLGCKTNAVVNPERVVQQRIGEFGERFLGFGSNHGGCDRTPDALSRNGEHDGQGGNALKALMMTGYGKTPRTLALRVLR
jgi:hypothetical protein